MPKNFVSIITVNYNGLKFLDRFLNSAVNLNCSKNLYEIIVVDNASNDGSVDFVKRNYPEVRLVESNKNLGFGGGNNLGIKNSSADFFLLVNNDTLLDKDILNNLIDCYQKLNRGNRLAAIACKMVLYDWYIPINISEARFEESRIYGENNSWSKSPLNVTYDSGVSFLDEIFLPIEYQIKHEIGVTLTLLRWRRNKFSIKVGSKNPTEESFESKNDVKKVHFSLSKKDILDERVDLIQNAGNFLFRDGFGRDRGTIVCRDKQFYEPDLGQYDKPEFIPAFCGAGVLINKRAIRDIGFFDEDFFMYYEDDDLSLRMRKAGWKIGYCPKALIRHVHTATSKEWSDFFIFHTERNRLLLVSKHWPYVIVLREWLKYFFYNTFAVSIYYWLKGKPRTGFKRLRIRVLANLSLIWPIFKNLFNFNRLTKKELKGFL